MGVPTSEVGYTIATTRRETTKVHKNMWWHWRKKKTKEINWFIGKKKSQLYIENKLLIYKAVFKPIWSYGMEVWGCASKSNIVILQIPNPKFSEPYQMHPVMSQIILYILTSRSLT